MGDSEIHATVACARRSLVDCVPRRSLGTRWWINHIWILKFVRAVGQAQFATKGFALRRDGGWRGVVVSSFDDSFDRRPEPGGFAALGEGLATSDAFQPGAEINLREQETELTVGNQGSLLHDILGQMVIAAKASAIGIEHGQVRRKSAAERVLIAGHCQLEEGFAVLQTSTPEGRGRRPRMPAAGLSIPNVAEDGFRFKKKDKCVGCGFCPAAAAFGPRRGRSH
jgi:hypothetical protein